MENKKTKAKPTLVIVHIHRFSFQAPLFSAHSSLLISTHLDLWYTLNVLKHLVNPFFLFDYSARIDFVVRKRRHFRLFALFAFFRSRFLI